MPRKTQEQFELEANLKHDNFYSYEKFIYLGAKVKSIIGCPIHGDFEQQPTSHLNGIGCPECGRNKSDKNRKKWTIESYKKEVGKLHPDLDFSETVYVNPKTKVKYSCKLHGLKTTLPYNLLSGHGCKECSLFGAYISKDDWIKKFKKFGSKNIQYYKIPDGFLSEDKITFVCDIHGEFKQTARICGKCPKCGRDKIYEVNRKSPTGWSYTNWEKAGIKSKRFEYFKCYIIKCWNDEEEFYKIGKTYLPIKKRFDSKYLMPYKYEIIKIFQGKAKEVSKLEKELQKENKHNNYIPSISFQGMYECFSEIKYV